MWPSTRSATTSASGCCRVGLARGPSWRRYPDEILVRLRYVREGRSVGATLRELRHLLDLTVASAPRFCETFDAAVNEKICAIDQMVARLLAQRARPQEFSRDCRQRRREGRCPILENLRPQRLRTVSSGRAGQGSKSEASAPSDPRRRPQAGPCRAARRPN